MMTTYYTKHPRGYPQSVCRIAQAGSQWALEIDIWQTPTSHAGWRRGEMRYETRAAAEEALREWRDEARVSVYVVRDAGGEYISDRGTRTPASDEAREYETEAEAQAACTRLTDRVLRREV